MIILVVSLIVSGALFGATAIRGARFMFSWFCLECGIVGGFVSIQQRLNKLELPEASVMADSWFAIALAPSYGGIFALILYFLFLANLLAGQLFPEFSIPKFHDPPTSDDIRVFFTQTYPKTGADFAKFAFWSFVAGFSERFVPGIVQHFTDNAGTAVRGARGGG
jgi:hypothetical protein